MGAIAPQGFEPLLESIRDCLRSTDWATRKAAADALSALALHSSSFIADEAANSMLTVLEASHFDKVAYFLFPPHKHNILVVLLTAYSLYSYCILISFCGR